MTWGDLGAVATVLGALVAVVTLYITTRNGVRERAEKQRAREAQLFQDGAKSRDVEVAQIHANAERDRQTAENEKALLRSQRDDARRDRDENGRRADRYEGLYNELRDRSN